MFKTYSLMLEVEIKQYSQILNSVEDGEVLKVEIQGNNIKKAVIEWKIFFNLCSK